MDDYTNDAPSAPALIADPIAEAAEARRVRDAVFAAHIAQREQRWIRYVAFLRGLGAQYTAYLAAEEAFPVSTLTFTPLAEESIRERLSTVVIEEINELVAEASRRFTVGTRALEIDPKPYCTRFWPDPKWGQPDTRDPLTFSPTKVWEALCAEFGGGQGHQKAYEAAAAKLYDEFSRRGELTPAVQGAHLVFRCSFWSEPRSSWRDNYATTKHAYQATYSYTSLDKLPAFFDGLLTFLTWHANGLTPTQAAADTQRLKSWCIDSAPFNSRDTHPLGPIRLRFFKDKMECHVPRELAGRLNLFLSQFAAARFASDRGA